jgi:nucleoside-diphosphate-sugar epimerase
MPAPTSDRQLDDLLEEPTADAADALARLPGDLIVLGAGGKMGPSLCRMARRAAEGRRRIFAASRFSNPAVVEQLAKANIKVLSGELLDRSFLATLPECPLVVYMAGMKFGSSEQPSQTWAVNTLLPALVCERFRDSRIVMFSTGNVYPLVPVAAGRGCVETDALAPLGEYAMTCLGRERMFEYCSQTFGIPVSIIRLNYATELRYGVLVDIARQVWERRPVSVAMGYVNVIWQADANAQALASLALADSPPFVLNVAGPEILRVQDVAIKFGELFGVPVEFTGTEAETALLNDAGRARELFGPPRVSAAELIEWIANWIQNGRGLWNRPTHFEVRDGKF